MNIIIIKLKIKKLSKQFANKMINKSLTKKCNKIFWNRSNNNFKNLVNQSIPNMHTKMNLFNKLFIFLIKIFQDHKKIVICNKLITML